MFSHPPSDEIVCPPAKDQFFFILYLKELYIYYVLYND